jgi:predicted transcriptional regulator
MASAKEEVEALLNRLPDDCTLEDIQYQLYVLEKIRRGSESAETRPVLTHEQVEARLQKWLAV